MDDEQPTTGDQWMTVRDVAEYLKVHEETVRRWIREGELPVLDLGGQKTGYRILRGALDQYISERYGLLGKTPPREALGGAEEPSPSGLASGEAPER